MSFRSYLSADKDVKSFQLKEVCEVLTGLDFKSSFYRDSGFPIVKVKNIQDGQITTDNLHYCDPENHPKAELVKYGDVVMARCGSPGRVGINLTDQEFFFRGEVFKFVPNEKLLTKRYLYHFLLSQQEELKGLERGSAILGIRKSELEKIRIPVPSLEIQERIVETLDKFREIEREINLRDKQYEYYRNYLLMGSSGGSNF